jgi:uncharacterized damage-inducible protein DinB
MREAAMTAKDVIRQVVEFCHMVTRGYIEDLADRDLFLRVVPKANHIAWQLGHLLAADCEMLAQIGHKPPALPAGFAEAHTKETAASDDPGRFFKKSEYLGLMEKTQAATLAAIDATPEQDLDQPAPEAMRGYAPTKAAVLTLLGTHWLMHAGQFVPIRRKLGKPPMF